MGFKSATKNLAFLTRTGSSSTRMSARGHGFEQATTPELAAGLDEYIPDMIEALRAARIAAARGGFGAAIAHENMSRITAALAEVRRQIEAPTKFAYESVFLRVSEGMLSAETVDAIKAEVSAVFRGERAVLAERIDAILRESGVRVGAAVPPPDALPTRPVFVTHSDIVAARQRATRAQTDMLWFKGRVGAVAFLLENGDTAGAAAFIVTISGIPKNLSTTDNPAGVLAFVEDGVSIRLKQMGAPKSEFLERVLAGVRTDTANMIAKRTGRVTP